MSFQVEEFRMRRFLGRAGVLLIVCVVAVFACTAAFAADAATADSGAFYDKTLEQITEQFQTYSAAIEQSALRLFYVLFVIQLAWGLIQLMLPGAFTLDALAVLIVRQAICGTFFYWLIGGIKTSFGMSLADVIVESFTNLGNLGKFSFGQYLTIMNNILVSLAKVRECLNFLTSPVIVLTLWITALAIVLVFSLIAGRFLMLLAERYILSYLGVILLGFGGNDWSRQYALSYIRSLISIGMKIFAMTFLVKLGMDLLSAQVGGLDAQVTIVNKVNEFTGEVTSESTLANADSIEQQCLIFISEAFVIWTLSMLTSPAVDNLLAGAAGAFAFSSAMSGIRSTGAMAGSTVVPAAAVAAGTVGATVGATAGGIAGVGESLMKMQQAADVSSGADVSHRPSGGKSDPMELGVSVLGNQFSKNGEPMSMGQKVWEAAKDGAAGAVRGGMAGGSAMYGLVSNPKEAVSKAAASIKEAFAPETGFAGSAGSPTAYSASANSRASASVASSGSSADVKTVTDTGVITRLPVTDEDAAGVKTAASDLPKKEPDLPEFVFGSFGSEQEA